MDGIYTVLAILGIFAILMFFAWLAGEMDYPVKTKKTLRSLLEGCHNGSGADC